MAVTSEAVAWDPSRQGWVRIRAGAMARARIRAGVMARVRSMAGAMARVRAGFRVRVRARVRVRVRVGARVSSHALPPSEEGGAPRDKLSGESGVAVTPGFEEAFEGGGIAVTPGFEEAFEGGGVAVTPGFEPRLPYRRARREVMIRVRVRVRVLVSSHAIPPSVKGG